LSDGQGQGLREPVGPVLQATDEGRAVAEVILASNPGATLLDRGGYLRVLAPSPCQVSQSALEARLGRPFHLPTALEALMPAFKGRLSFLEGLVRWELGTGRSEA
jgi:hypothetical protein